MDWFSSYRPFSKRAPIRVGNNEYIYALGVGEIKFISHIGNQTINLTLRNVQYVPHISNNLFYLGAAEANGASLRGANGKLLISVDGEVLLEGVRVGANLYKLHVEAPLTANIAKSERSREEWHEVLGHPDQRKVEPLAKCNPGELKIIDRSNGFDCGSCAAGKAHKASHPVSRRPRADQVLHRVHTDLVDFINPPLEETVTSFCSRTNGAHTSMLTS